MRRVVVRAFVALVGLALGLAAPASAFDFRAEVDQSTVAVGEQLTLQLTVSGTTQNLPRVSLPAIDGFDAYSAGTSQNIALVNGQMSVGLTQSFLLVAKRAGTFTLGPFQLEHNGETRTTKPITVTVTAETDAPGGSAPPPQRRRPGAAPRTTGTPEYFVRAEVDKKEAYVNEQITLVFRFYSRVRLSRDPEYAPPSAVNFWVEDLPPVRRYYEKIDGAQYLVNEVKSALFPTTAGELTIGPASLKIARSMLDDLWSRDPFQVFNRGRSQRNSSGVETLKTDPITVTVRPLPRSGKPEGFSGLVGRYALSARLDKETVEANEPITMTLILSGDGNMGTAPDPELQIPSGVRTYDSGSRINTSKQDYRLRGEKVVEKVLIPQSPGNLLIPPARIVVFDPEKGSYRTLQTDTLRVRVTPSTGTIAAAGEAHDVRRIGHDLNAVRGGSGVLEPPRRWRYRRPAFWALQLLPLAAFFLAVSAGRTRRRLGRDQGFARAQRARGFARKRLKMARRAMDGDNGGEFFALLGRSVTDYVADKLRVSRHGAHRDGLLDALHERGLDGDLVERLSALLDRCDMGRFAPGADDPAERSGLLQRSEQLIVDLDRAIRD